MSQVRLQKFLAECGAGSRRKMEQFITEGRVRVNGQVVTELGRKIDPDTDQVEVNRRPVHAAPKGIVLLNKPRGVVSTLSDPEGRRTVSEFITKKYASYFPVGRLDWDSTGLMILTNDGEMAERLMHPRYEFERIYEARVEGSVPQVALDKLRQGVKLSDGMVSADAAVLRSDENTTWVQVVIREGRNRVVRRVFEKLGHPVVKLKRTVYGPFKLGRLQVGQVRVLTLKEYLQVRRKVMTASQGDKSEDRAFERDRERKSASRSRFPRRDDAGRASGRKKGAPRGDKTEDFSVERGREQRGSKDSRFSPRENTRRGGGRKNGASQGGRARFGRSIKRRGDRSER